MSVTFSLLSSETVRYVQHIDPFLSIKIQSTREQKEWKMPVPATATAEKGEKKPVPAPAPL
jgi:hypothetical protein